ncbi:MAG TPA: hypothetical protein VIP75_01720 [Acidothermales bacterium]
MTEPLTGIDLPLQSIVSGRQPYLHDLVAAVCAPAVCLTGVDGQVRPEGVRGLCAFDKRGPVPPARDVDGEEPTAIQGRPLGGRMRPSRESPAQSVTRPLIRPCSSIATGKSRPRA